jgi:DNA-binding LacI/PurR family transcriptional regulator
VVAGGIVHRGLTPVLCICTTGGMTEPAYVEMLLQKQVSGMVFFGGTQAEAAASHEHFAQLHKRGVPVVLLNASGERLGFPTVSTDDVAGVELAFAHLRSLGHTRIGMVLGPPDHVPSGRKNDAFLRLSTAVGLSVDNAVERSMFTVEGGQLATSLLIERGITAAICASDMLALGGIKAVRRAGLSVPVDFSVIGFDDSFLMNCTDPPLSTVRQPIEAMGRAALTLLLNQIEGSLAPARELLFEPELVVRGSTGAAPAQLRTCSPIRPREMACSQAGVPGPGKLTR